jgi:hypothetical protein
MFHILLNWACLALLLMGVGHGCAKLLGVADDDGPSLTLRFWLGWAALILVLQVWHLLLPVDGRFVAVLVLFAAAGLLPGARSLAKRAVAAVRSAPWAAALTLAAAIWIANRALDAPQNGDSGMYHLQAVHWINAYAAVPGLGNLHPSLGFNHAYFLYAALVEAMPFGAGVQHVANGLLVLVFLARCFGAAARILGRGTSRGAVDVVDLALLPAAVMLALGHDVSSASSDLAEFALAAFVGSELAARLDTSRPTSGSSRDWLGLAVLACALGVTKLSSAFFAAGVLAYGSVRLFRSGKRRVAGWLLVIGTTAFLPWAIHSVIRSGYLPYPGQLLAFDVDWRVPSEVARGVELYTRAWARLTLSRWDQPEAGWAWLGPWARGLLLENQAVLAPVGLALAAGIVHAARMLIRRGGTRRLPASLVLPAAGGLLAWFLTAPDVRYAGAGLWVLAAQAAALAVDGSAVWGVLKWRTALVGSFGLLAVAFIAVDPPAPITSGPVALPTIALSSFRTDSGLVLQVPQGGICWGASLMCTAYPDSRLRLRVPGDPSHGFALSRAPDDPRPLAIEGIFPGSASRRR